ncbi:MAG: hypothetical protein QHH06_04125 [Clostridiales bacterium]|jgi:hypothetical protein|nr:hypothetical protein [Eubacteriales bacterium]MDH7565654.1 hypothetical protein [Clostridiales bacterium]
MRKIHLLLLIIAAVMAVSSVYSLAAINQVYSIGFEWYSQYYGKFLQGPRETSMDSWKLQGYPVNMHFDIIQSNYKPPFLKGFGKIKDTVLSGVDYNRYLLLYCTLGEVNSFDYRVKIISLAQRGKVVEVMVSVNSPSKQEENRTGSTAKYFPEDMVKIEKSAFPLKGKLNFIFKNQDGIKLYERDYYIK